jgi:hypothetical protein
MHFLRFEPRMTLDALDDAGVSYDTSLGYAEHAGFRCGTCREYTGYDLIRRSAFDIRVRPLIAMESSVMSPTYMNLGVSSEAFEVFRDLKRACRIVAGKFTLLWHNSELETRGKRSLYQEILDC